MTTVSTLRASLAHSLVTLLVAEFGAHDGGVVQVRILGLELAEERFDPGLVVWGAGSAEVLGDPRDGHQLCRVIRVYL